MTIHHHIHLYFISLFVITAFLCTLIIIKKTRNKKEPKLLTKEKYNSTMGKIQEIALSEVIVFNIWPYVDKLKLKKIVSKKIKEQELIHKIYRNSTGEFEHILLSTEKENHFVVILVDRSKKKIMGYYLLDLNGEYGLVA
jgi:hypothetical protein